MTKVLVIASREFWEMVKTKMFIISTVLMPVLIVATLFGTEAISNMADKEVVPVRTLGVIDRHGGITPALETEVSEYNASNENRPIAVRAFDAAETTTDDLAKSIEAGELYAYLVIPPGVLEGSQSIEFGRADSKLQAGRTIQNLVNSAVVEVRFATADPPVDKQRIDKLRARVAFKQVDTRSGQETTGTEMAQIMTPFAFMFLLFMATMNISQGLLTSLIEEKSSRVVEVLLSAVSPVQLLAGKVLGMVAVGAMLILVWGSVGYFGAASRDMAYLVTPFRLTYMVLYFIPGFLFFAAGLAAVGSACNTIKDAQGLSMPLTMMTIIPLMLWWYLTEHPTSTMSVVLSYFPPVTPFVMILRICADPETPLWQIVSTLVLLWASVIAMIWAAAKIFRVGVLMYGKTPSLVEMLRWVRYA